MAAHGALAQQHKQELSNGMLGFILFLASEVMFFGGLFAAYFISRADSVQWPPTELLTPAQVANHVELKLEWGLPLIATCLLILSSFTIQWGVVQIRKGNRTGLIWALFVSLTLGLVFLALQMYDYSQLSFGAGDTVFGTTFYTLTGFHGAHVAGGCIFMAIVLVRSMGGQFSAEHHEAIEAASMYWHFVDIVWIALFTTLYIVG
ncbi:MAG: cytochrome c oxidase subunit 3 [Tepidiformaceae bacterium]